VAYEKEKRENHKCSGRLIVIIDEVGKDVPVCKG
jgi:hypothetical protein